MTHQVAMWVWDHWDVYVDILCCLSSTYNKWDVLISVFSQLNWLGICSASCFVHTQTLYCCFEQKCICQRIWCCCFSVVGCVQSSIQVLPMIITKFLVLSVLPLSGTLRRHFANLPWSTIQTRTKTIHQLRKSSWKSQKVYHYLVLLTPPPYATNSTFDHCLICQFFWS